MGKPSGKLYSGKQQLNKFKYFLLHDIKALEKMLAEDMFEKDVQRIGAEQELCLLDKSWRPAPLIMEVLKKIDDPHFTTEHSKYNLEINMDPLKFSGKCLSTMEKTLRRHLSKLDKVLKEFESHYILVGILPTIRRFDLELENLTPLQRYHLLGKTMYRLRGGPFEFRIEGADELITKHDSIMFEGCNTSFQVHFQVSPDTFVDHYNWAQVIAAPVLAAATNSPLLLGKRLWRETRIALFQQSVDTRGFADDLREQRSRITFGNGWVKKSITEIFQEDIARHRVLIATEIKEDSIEALNNGQIPELEALQVHNGTVYKWNRACYGITKGKPHLRIENRILPSGPTVVDEIANTAFWLGLMNGMPNEYENIAEKLEFDNAKLNFFKVAHFGLETQLRWVDNQTIPADELIINELLPIARNGLKKAAIRKDEIDKYLGIIKERVKKRKTGAKWILDSYAKLQKTSERYEACVAITAAIVDRQRKERPVHKWQLAEIDEAGEWVNRYWKVEQIMSTDLFTVQKDDSIYFASNVMTWKHLRYIPVEDERGKLVGLLTSSALLGYYSTDIRFDEKTCIKDIMIKSPITVSPNTLSVDALRLMRESGVGCLPVVKDGKLVGMLTELNFMNFSEHNVQQLIEESKRFIGNNIETKN